MCFRVCWGILPSVMTRHILIYPRNFFEENSAKMTTQQFCPFCCCQPCCFLDWVTKVSQKGHLKISLGFFHTSIFHQNLLQFTGQLISFAHNSLQARRHESFRSNKFVLSVKQTQLAPSTKSRFRFRVCPHLQLGLDSHAFGVHTGDINGHHLQMLRHEISMMLFQGGHVSLQSTGSSVNKILPILWVESQHAGNSGSPWFSCFFQPSQSLDFRASCWLVSSGKNTTAAEVRSIVKSPVCRHNIYKRRILKRALSYFGRDHRGNNLAFFHVWRNGGVLFAWQCKASLELWSRRRAMNHEAWDC